MVKLFQRTIQRSFVQRIFQLGSITISHIDAVIVFLSQHILVKQGLDGPEAVPEGKLIQTVCFKVLHKPATG